MAGRPRVESTLDAFRTRLTRLKARFTLEEMTLGGKRLTEALAEEIGQHHYRRSRREQGPDGKRWAPLSPGYLRAKLRAGYPAAIGIRTGEMLAYQRFVHRAYRLQGKTLIVLYSGSAGAKAKLAYFQAGGWNRPYRDVLGPDKVLVARLNQMVEQSGREAIRRILFG